MDAARAQLDEALYSSGLRTQEQICRLVEESRVRNGASAGAPGTSAQGSTKKEAFALDKKSAEVWAFLEGLRGVAWKEGAADVSGGSGASEWKVHENAGDFHVTYREAPGDMAAHNICVEGMLNEATKSDFGSSWVASHGDAEGHQSIVHTLKAARAQKQSGSNRPHPFNAAEVLVEEFLLGNDATLLLVGAPSSKNGSHPPSNDKHPLAKRPFGCFLFKRTSASQCYFRALADIAPAQGEEARAFVAAVARQLAGLGTAVFGKISARDFRDPSETAIRVTLKKGDAELGSVVITAFEKIKHDLGERLRKPGVVDRDALSAWLKAAKMDVAGEPKVEFRPVEGCSSEELSKALLELESCGSNLDNVTTPGGVHLEVSIGEVKQSGGGQFHTDTSSPPLAVGDDSESEAEFLDSAEELKQEEDSESDASTRERGVRNSESGGSSRSKSPRKLESRPVDAHAPSSKPERNASKDKASGGAAMVGRAAVTARGGSASKKMTGRKRPAEALESVEDVLAKLASAVREVESEPSTSHGHPPKTGAGPAHGSDKKEKERDVVLGLGPGISHRQGGAKAPYPPRKEDTPTAGFIDIDGSPTRGSDYPAAGGVPSMEINPLERGGDSVASAADEDSDGPPSMVGSEEESEDELPPPRQDFMTVTDPDILRARILELTARAEQLEAKSRQSTEWAHEKVMQAARKGQNDSKELKGLRAEVEAAKQRQRDGEDRERGLTKKLRDSEDMVKRTQDYAKGLEKKLFMLEKHLKEVRSELEASLLKESETAAREAKALKAEKVLQKKTAAWEKQRKAMQEEINGERARANGLAAAAERAEESARQASVRARQEERAAREAGDRAAAEKRARELAEKDHKRKDAAAKKVSDTAAEKFRAEIARLEREVARLKLAEHGTVYGFEAPPPVPNKVARLARTNSAALKMLRDEYIYTAEKPFAWGKEKKGANAKAPPTGGDWRKSPKGGVLLKVEKEGLVIEAPDGAHISVLKKSHKKGGSAQYRKEMAAIANRFMLDRNAGFDMGAIREDEGGAGESTPKKKNFARGGTVKRGGRSSRLGRQFNTGPADSFEPPSSRNGDATPSSTEHDGFNRGLESGLDSWGKRKRTTRQGPDRAAKKVFVGGLQDDSEAESDEEMENELVVAFETLPQTLQERLSSDFWREVEPYFAFLREEDLAFLRENFRELKEGDVVLSVPRCGEHFRKLWANEDQAGRFLLDDNPKTPGPDCEEPPAAEAWLQKAGKVSLSQRLLAALIDVEEQIEGEQVEKQAALALPPAVDPPNPTSPPIREPQTHEDAADKDPLRSNGPSDGGPIDTVEEPCTLMQEETPAEKGVGSGGNFGVSEESASAIPGLPEVLTGAGNVRGGTGAAESAAADSRGFDDRIQRSAEPGVEASAIVAERGGTADPPETVQDHVAIVLESDDEDMDIVNVVEGGVEEKAKGPEGAPERSAWEQKFDAMTLDERIQWELQNIGLVDGKEEEPEAREDDPVCFELRSLQRQLREQLDEDNARLGALEQRAAAERPNEEREREKWALFQFLEKLYERRKGARAGLGPGSSKGGKGAAQKKVAAKEAFLASARRALRKVAEFEAGASVVPRGLNRKWEEKARAPALEDEEPAATPTDAARRGRNSAGGAPLAVKDDRKARQVAGEYAVQELPVVASKGQRTRKKPVNKGKRKTPFGEVLGGANGTFGGEKELDLERMREREADILAEAQAAAAAEAAAARAEAEQQAAALNMGPSNFEDMTMDLSALPLPDFAGLGDDAFGGGFDMDFGLGADQFNELAELDKIGLDDLGDMGF